MKEYSTEIIAPLALEELKASFRQAKPFPHMCIDGFLREPQASRIAAAVPSFEEAQRLGRGFNAVNERRKYQITNSEHFPEPIAKLHQELSSPTFLEALSFITGIDELQPDPELKGGGLHQTGSRGHLDVHIDFNYIKARMLHRRLNILVYLNEEWDASWGGALELWDKDVRNCEKTLTPQMNRCVVFETSEISWHGVTAVKCPEGMCRKSFAGYYYTYEPGADIDAVSHSTIFKARPNERLKGKVLMPAQKIRHSLSARAGQVKRILHLG